MSNSAAGSDRWDEPNASPGRAGREPEVDPRTTQPMPPIDRSESEPSPPASPWSASADTVRVEAPAWFLRAQQRAAEQNKASRNDATSGDESDDDDEDAEPADRFDDPASGDTDGDDESFGADTDSEAGTPEPIDPARVVYGVEVGVEVDPDESVDDGPGGSGASTDQPAKFLDPAVASSYREPTPPPDLVAGAVGLFGAALLAIGSFLTWARSDGIVEATVNGLTGSNGWGTLTCGMVVALGSALVLTGRRSAVVGGVMLVASLAAVYLCGFSAVDIVSTSDELPTVLVGAGVERGAAETASLELATGFVVVAAGAAVSLVGGAIAFARRV